MTDFFVDLDAVGELAGRLLSIHDALAATEKAMTSGGDGLGSNAVSTALHDFRSGWSDGRKTIEEEVSHLAQAARGAAETYRQAEQSIVAATHSGGVQTATKSVGPV